MKDTALTSLKVFHIIFKVIILNYYAMNSTRKCISYNIPIDLDKKFRSPNQCFAIGEQGLGFIEFKKECDDKNMIFFQ